MFSGLASTTSVTQDVQLETTSNNHCNPDGAQSCPLPCTTPVCPLCICIIADSVLSIEILTNFHIAELSYADIFETIPGPFLSDIFHPPKSANRVAVFHDVRRDVDS
jgi:hypothetical protein